MFWEIYVRLCHEKGISPNAEARKAGVKSTGTVSAWKKGAIPRDGVLARIADDFGVTSEYLLGLTSESYSLWTQTHLARLEQEYAQEKNEERRATLAAEIDGFRESIEDQLLANRLNAQSKKAPTDDGGRITETDFTYAAHKYEGDLLDEDKAMLIKLMRSMAETNNKVNEKLNGKAE